MRKENNSLYNEQTKMSKYFCKYTYVWSSKFIYNYRPSILIVCLAVHTKMKFVAICSPEIPIPHRNTIPDVYDGSNCPRSRLSHL